MDFEIRSELVPGVERRRFIPNGQYHYYVRVYLVPGKENGDLAAVESVQYKLHPTFRQRLQVSEERMLGFEIKIWTYGFFDIEALVIFLDKSRPPQTITGIVEWTLPWRESS
jgi:transcription initiation factor IIF auxiliary subunit